MQRVGRKIGQILKMDACTTTTLRGRYAGICVQVPMDTPLKSSITVGTHNKQLHYKGEGFLCKGCRKLGHTKECCTIQDVKILEKIQSTVLGKSSTDEWNTMSFNYIKGPIKHETPQNHHIKVKTFDMASGTFLKPHIAYQPKDDHYNPPSGNHKGQGQGSFWQS